MAGNMDSEIVLKFIGYFSDYLSALSRTLLRFFGQPLLKQLYTDLVLFSALAHVDTSTLSKSSRDQKIQPTFPHVDLGLGQ